MKRIALFLLIAVVAISSADAQEVIRTKQKEKDGFKWTLLEKWDYIENCKYKGVEIKKGVEIVPLEGQYKKVNYIGDGFFSTYKEDEGTHVINRNGKKILEVEGNENKFACGKGVIVFNGVNRAAVYDTTGHVIIPFEKGFEKILFYPEYNDPCLYVRKGESSGRRNTGACDLKGREIIGLSRGYCDVGLIKKKKNAFDTEKSLLYFLISIRNDTSERKYTYGVCDINGIEIIAPKYPIVGLDDNGHYFYYTDERYDYKDERYNIQHYLGVKLDDNCRAVPDPDHPLGHTDKPLPREHIEEQTAYNNTTTYNNSYDNSYNNTYSNTYTPPAQQKQQSSGTKSKTSSTTQPKSTSSSSSSSNTSTNKSSSSTHKPSPHKNNASSFQSGPVKCANCSGTGMARCWSCSGKGTIRKSGIDKNGKQVFRNERCTGCGGSGKRKCTVCNGKGTR
ncbi:MAG: hypothetical protein IKQ53_00060 [Bacteroidales bacterium]|nr:hypothetical protein [Bacteroidales bacterium]